MDANSQTWIFMSVFYRQSSWHLLLKAAREIIELPEVREELIDFRLFLNQDRGECLRLALKMKHSADCHASQIISHSIRQFLRCNSTKPRPVILPVSSFFTDFENNTIHYNLFNTRSIMIGRLATIQSLISKLLLRFFDDHPVDEQGLFTMVVYLQKSILEGLCSSQKEKIDLLITVSKQIKMNAIKIDHEILLEADQSNRNSITEDFVSIPDIQTILSKLELAVQTYDRESLGKARNFLIILNIIKPQLFKIEDSIFLDGLDYLYNKLNKQIQLEPIKKANDIISNVTN